MNILEYMENYNHEQLTIHVDPEVGLRAIIAIHDTTLGPALGGCRMWEYETEESATLDALRLAKAMTYKSAVAGLNFGGGKAVIIRNSSTDKREALFQSYGRFVNTLGGRYITTEDVGTTTQDMEHISTQTTHVVGLPKSLGGSDDPSYATSIGVFEGIRASLKWALGNSSLNGKHVTIQGFGKVAYHLARQLKEDGAELTVSDIDPEKMEQAKTEFSATTVSPNEVYDVPCDIFAPCALGNVINDVTIQRLQCAIVAGCANNQLSDDVQAERLAYRGILYAPDYVINAGGVINLSFEKLGYNEERALRRTREIGETLQEVFATAKKEGIDTAKAANLIAENRLAKAREEKNGR